MDKYDISQFIIISFVLLAIVYTKYLLRFSTTFLGKWVTVSIIAFYSTIDKYYGLLAATILVWVHHYAHEEEWFWREGFDKKTDCDRGILSYKGARVNPEMAEHVFPEIVYRHPEYRCNPCDDKCAFTVSDNKLNTEDTLRRHETPKELNKEAYSWESILEYWRTPAASSGVVTEGFSYVQA